MFYHKSRSINGKKDRTDPEFYDREEPSVVMLKMLERALRRCNFDKDSEKSEQKIVYRLFLNFSAISIFVY